MSLAGVGTFSSRPSALTLPESQSSSSLLPRSRSLAIDDLMPGSILLTNSKRSST